MEGWETGCERLRLLPFPILQNDLFGWGGKDSQIAITFGIEFATIDGSAGNRFGEYIDLTTAPVTIRLCLENADGGFKSADHHLATVV
jgi:hypothetical protein